MSPTPVYQAGYRSFGSNAGEPEEPAFFIFYAGPRVEMPTASCPIALFYDDDAYVETLRRSPRQPGEGRPFGLMGRQVAGKEFLKAFLDHGSWTELVALVRDSGR